MSDSVPRLLVTVAVGWVKLRGLAMVKDEKHSEMMRRRSCGSIAPLGLG